MCRIVQLNKGLSYFLYNSQMSHRVSLYLRNVYNSNLICFTYYFIYKPQSISGTVLMDTQFSCSVFGLEHYWESFPILENGIAGGNGSCTIWVANAVPVWLSAFDQTHHSLDISCDMYYFIRNVFPPGSPFFFSFITVKAVWHSHDGLVTPLGYHMGKGEALGKITREIDPIVGMT